jgi:hypothetical protein
MGHPRVFTTAGRVISSHSPAIAAVVRKEQTSAAESRVPFRLPYGTSGTRALPDLSESRRIFESALERERRSFRVQVYGYVVMPEQFICCSAGAPSRQNRA